jgi:hypothetical protein
MSLHNSFVPIIHLEPKYRITSFCFSEARRHNSTLPASLPSAPLRPLLRPLPLASSPGVLDPPTPSPAFPQDLKALFSLDAEAAKTLVTDYGLDDGAPLPGTKNNLKVETDLKKGVKGSRDQNVNRFMAHIGVRFSFRH